MTDAGVWLRSFAFNVLVWAATIVMLIGMFPLLAFPRRYMQRVVRIWARLPHWALRRVVGLDARIVGLDRIPPGPVILASKHESAWETYVFHILFEDACYVLKRELMRIPLWGWYARKCRSVVVDRAGAAAALKKMVRDARVELDSGRPLVIFPEGTRTPPGVRRPYHPGVYAVHGATGRPVVPVAVNSGLFWARRAFLKRPGVVTLEFLEPLRAGLDRRAFMAELQDRIEFASDRLAREALAEFPDLPRTGTTGPPKPGS